MPCRPSSNPCSCWCPSSKRDTRNPRREHRFLRRDRFHQGISRPRRRAPHLCARFLKQTYVSSSSLRIQSLLRYVSRTDNDFPIFSPQRSIYLRICLLSQGMNKFGDKRRLTLSTKSFLFSKDRRGIISRFKCLRYTIFLTGFLAMSRYRW